MKYPVEQLLIEDDIDCHEVRATVYDKHLVLLHFFITHPEDDSSLPEFKMGYERYTIDSDENQKNIKPKEDNIVYSTLIHVNDQANILFNFSSNPNLDLQKNEWTGEQPEIIEGNTADSELSPMSPENISVNKDLRYVSEMADNSIYSTDDVINTDTYLAQKDESIKEANTSYFDSSEGKTHSIWKSEIHWKKYKECSVEEFITVFKKYKPYIGLFIPKNLDTESAFNIQMEELFGAAFDIVRIKNNLFSDDDNNMVGGSVSLS